MGLSHPDHGFHLVDYGDDPVQCPFCDGTILIGGVTGFQYVELACSVGSHVFTVLHVDCDDGHGGTYARLGLRPLGTMPPPGPLDTVHEPGMREPPPHTIHESSKELTRDTTSPIWVGHDGGGVRKRENGKWELVVQAGTTALDLAMSNFMILIAISPPSERREFATLVGLPVDVWTDEHRETLLSAIMHGLDDIRTGRWPRDPGWQRIATELLQGGRLPPRRCEATPALESFLQRTFLCELPSGDR